MIRQFTFHKPKEILQPTLWLFLSQACSMLPAILAYMAIYTLGEAFVPPYTLDLFRLITLAALGVGCFVLQYIVELISYYFTYGKAYRDTADKRIAYIQKLRRQPLGFFSSKESGELISSFSNDFANVEYTLCYWLPYPLGVGALLAISIVTVERCVASHVQYAARLCAAHVAGCQGEGEAQRPGHGGKGPRRYTDQRISAGHEGPESLSPYRRGV